MDYSLALIAGAIQGLTEFLPISSTGHLIIFEKFFHLSADKFGLTFDASLHLGTLLAVIIFFYKDYLKILNPKNKMLTKLIAGTIPAVILGLLFESVIESYLRSIEVVAISMIIFSFVLILAEKVGKKQKSQNDVKIVDSLIIGLFQGLALIPGISRSGSTISAGLFLGLTREQSARFAFLLSGPIIAGAGLKKFSEVIFLKPANYDIGIFVLGILSSALFGYLTIKYFIIYLTTKNLYPFIFYRLAVGIILLLGVNL